MALEKGARPLVHCLRCPAQDRIAGQLTARAFTTSSAYKLDAEPSAASTSRPPLDPYNVASARGERKLLRETRQVPIGSRRRRAAIKSTPNIPFEQLPYQCFQEARSILQEDRAEKLKAISVERARIDRLQETVVVGQEQEAHKERRLTSMRDHLERLKVLADVNDPLVKKTFEDGHGDLSKPIYRYLADKKWRSYERKIVVQRIEQMHIVPDILPSIDPTVSTTLSFSPVPSIAGSNTKRRRNIPHGDFVDSRLSEKAPYLHIQPYSKGKQLVTIALINPDVPNVAKDGFDYRCHFLACNVPISPTLTSAPLGLLDPETQVLHDWLPPYTQKGLPYQRMAIIILAQSPAGKVTAGSDETPSSDMVNVAEIKAQSRKYSSRDNFILREFVDKFKMKPLGVHLFRTQWDEGTAEVMQRAGIAGWDVEFKRKKILPLPYQRLKGERYR